MNDHKSASLHVREFPVIERVWYYSFKLILQESRLSKYPRLWASIAADT